MKATPLVDEQGHFIEDVLVEDSLLNVNTFNNTDTIISVPVPPGLYQPRWDFNQATWTEGMSAQDIAALQPVASETPEQKIARLEQSDLDNKELIASLYEMLIAQGGQ